MENRKLQRTGGSSLSVTLPKKWTDQIGLQDKESVSLSLEGRGILITPTQKKGQLLQSTIKIEGLTKSMLVRELIANYISGVDEIIIQSQQILPEQRNSIRSIANLLIGFELIDESSKRIVLKNVFDPTKFPVTKSVEKMFLMSIAMLNDVIKAFVGTDKQLAQDIIERDMEVDKVYLAVLRQLHSLRENLISKEQLDIDPLEINFYENVATQLERIADHCVTVAKQIHSLDLMGKKEHKETILHTDKATAVRTINALKDAHKMIEKLDKKLAHTLIDTCDTIEEQFSSHENTKENEDFLLAMIENSLDRIRGYIVNLAEMTIDLAVVKENKIAS